MEEYPWRNLPPPWKTAGNMSSQSSSRFPLYLAKRTNSHYHSEWDVQGSVEIGDDKINLPDPVQTDDSFEIDDPAKLDDAVETYCSVPTGVSLGIDPFYDRGVDRQKHERLHDCHIFLPSSIDIGSAVRTNGQGMEVVNGAMLENTILQIFVSASQVWDPDLTNAQHDGVWVLDQCLRLASHFITHQKGAPFWCALVGKRNNDGGVKLSRIYAAEKVGDISERSVRNETTAWESENRYRFRPQDHVELMDQVNYKFPRIKFSVRPKGSGDQYMHPYTYFEVSSQSGGPGNRYHYTVWLHADICTVISFLSATNEQKKAKLESDEDIKCMQLRFNYMLATFLTAAIADILDHDNGMRVTAMAGRTYYPAANWSAVKTSSAGPAALQTLFGGMIAPISWRCDTMHGLARTAFASDMASGELIFDKKSYTVSVDYLAGLYYPDSWFNNLLGNSRSLEYFHHPKPYKGTDSHSFRHNIETLQFVKISEQPTNP